ncbi:MAG: IS256 family transposase, partial [Proteobacteria bacterium]|nr:IS256 family transposase [Pseudomonadota bacterium]
MPRKMKETKDLSPALPVSKQLLDQLVTGPMTPGQFENMFRGLKKAVLERALGAELTHHLGT